MAQCPAPFFKEFTLKTIIGRPKNAKRVLKAAPKATKAKNWPPTPISSTAAAAEAAKSLDGASF